MHLIFQMPYFLLIINKMITNYTKTNLIRIQMHLPQHNQDPCTALRVHPEKAVVHKINWNETFKHTFKHAFSNTFKHAFSNTFRLAFNKCITHIHTGLCWFDCVITQGYMDKEHHRHVHDKRDRLQTYTAVFTDTIILYTFIVVMHSWVWTASESLHHGAFSQ